MPVLNRVATIEKAIQSLLSQHYPNLEFIIIDGGSTDGTVEIIKRYETHISYWHSEPDESPSFAANFGIRKASGDFVALLMADDWYEPEVLYAIARAACAHPEADIITCGGRIVAYNDEEDAYESQWTYADERTLALNFYNVCFAVSAICCRFIRKSVFDRIGYYETANQHGKHMLCNDKEFLLRAILHGVNNVFVPMIGHNYLASAASSTFGNHKKNILALCRDHLWIAQCYLQKTNLSWQQRLTLHYWYTDQSTRLLIFSLLDKNFSELAKIAKEVIRYYPFSWPLAIIAHTTKIGLKRMLRYTSALKL